MSCDQKLTDLLKIDVIAEAHVLGVDAEDLESADGVRNSDVDLPIEAAEATQSRIDGVRPVGGGHHDDVRPLPEGHSIKICSLFFAGPGLNRGPRISSFISHQ